MVQAPATGAARLDPEGNFWVEMSVAGAQCRIQQSTVQGFVLFK
jgi:hypothetical protein